MQSLVASSELQRFLSLCEDSVLQERRCQNRGFVWFVSAPSRLTQELAFFFPRVSQ